MGKRSVLRKSMFYLQSSLQRIKKEVIVPSKIDSHLNVGRDERICIVSDFQGKNPIGSMARRFGQATKARHIFADTQATSWVYNPIMASSARFEEAMTSVLIKVASSRVTHLHLELGMYGKTLEQMRTNILKVIDASKEMVLFVHSLHVNDETFRPLYEEILIECNKKSAISTVNVWVNNEKDEANVKKIFTGKVVNSPVLYFTKRLRKELERRGSEIRRSRADKSIYVGVFGYINGHKDFQTTIRAFSLLPENYKLVIAGGAHPGERSVNHKNQSVVALDNLIWDFRNTTLIDRIIFRDSLGDLEFFSLMASLDVILINYLETAMSASSVLSQALELSVPVVASRCTTFESACVHFGNSWGFFDPGNSLQLRQKILDAQRVKPNTRIPTLEDMCRELSL